MRDTNCIIRFMSGHFVKTDWDNIKQRVKVKSTHYDKDKAYHKPVEQ